MIDEENRKCLRKPEELKYVDYECKNGVAWIKFNEPDRRNPLSLYRVSGRT